MKKRLLLCGLVTALIIPLQASAQVTDEGNAFLTEKNYPQDKIAYAWKLCKFQFEKWYCGAKSGLGISDTGSEEEALKKANDMITQNKDTFPYSEWKLKYYAFSGHSKDPDKCIIENTASCYQQVQVYNSAPFWCGLGPTIRNPLAYLNTFFPAEADTQEKATSQQIIKAWGNLSMIMCTQGRGSITLNSSLAEPRIELNEFNPEYKIIKVTKIENSGSSVRYSCIIDSDTSKEACSTVMNLVSNDPANLYFKVPNAVTGYITIKAERVHDPLMFTDRGGDMIPPQEGLPLSSTLQTIMQVKKIMPIAKFSNELSLSKYKPNEPQIAITFSDNKSSGGTVSNPDTSGNVQYSCVFAPGEDNNEKLPAPTNMQNYVKGADCLQRNNDGSLKVTNNKLSFTVPHGSHEQYFAIMFEAGKANTNSYIAGLSNLIPLKSLLEVPQIAITDSLHDSKSKSGKIFNPDTQDRVIYECVYDLGNKPNPAHYPYNATARLCTITRDAQGVNFTVAPELNGYSIAIKAIATNNHSTVTFSNPIFLQDEKKDNCSYTAPISNTYSDGTRCNPFPPCGAPKPEDFSINFFYPRFEVSFHSQRTPNTLMELQNFDGTKSIGQTNPWVNFVSDVVNKNDPAKPAYFDYRMYNICENGEKSKECCQVRVYKDSRDGTKRPPDICKQQCTATKNL